jgi:hypothetical protein
MTKSTLKIAITNYTKGQKYYILPNDCYCPIHFIEVWNEKKKCWRVERFENCLYLPDRKLKTDKEIRIYYDQKPTKTK